MTLTLVSITHLELQYQLREWVDFRNVQPQLHSCVDRMSGARSGHHGRGDMSKSRAALIRRLPGTTSTNGGGGGGKYRGCGGNARGFDGGPGGGASSGSGTRSLR